MLRSNASCDHLVQSSLCMAAQIEKSRPRQSQKMYSYVPRAKMNGKVRFYA